ncbi:hypothetical protein [Salinicoccus roseus]|uniref:hypothetical protein n=1 Tax=Salinicoccus roseus TaxID=45670 RepID=UPI000F4FAEAA|nr:hypothetical protein [Salinicoccus roseus]RPE54799.1 hypothetical protein EDC33_1062 [Salinicoccus roseus]GGA62542.1 hypothetical protein GCM10007176_03710 [Salinicoccus roseus]
MDKELLSQAFSITKDYLETSSLLDYHVQLNYGHLYYGNDTRLYNIGDADARIFMIGYILDIREDQKETEDILRALLSCYLNNEGAFLEELSYMNGRFIVILDDEADTVVYSDATAMRPMFYWNNTFISSHEIIIRETLEREFGINLDIRNYRMNGFLDFTDTESIYKFNPNMCFSFKNLKFTRIYPREVLNTLDMEEIFHSTNEYFPTQVSWLDKHYDEIHLSLTGGFDSKFSLAVTKPLNKKIHYFTYMLEFTNAEKYDDMSQFRKIYYKDKSIVDNLVYNFNLNHRYFIFGNYQMPRDFQKKLEYNLSSKHSFVLSYLTDIEFNKGGIHIKSTLYELVKMTHSEYADKQTDHETMIRNIKRWAPKEIRENYELLLEMYEAYYNRTKLENAVSNNANLPVLLYWEFRMGNWHSNLTQETDRTLETFVLINNRYMLDYFMRIKKEDRVAKSYLNKVVKWYWPALNYFVANSFDTLEDSK